MGWLCLAGTADTKGAELAYLRDLLRPSLPHLRVVDLGSGPRACEVDVTAAEVAAHHPDGAGFLETRDRGTLTAGMGEAFAVFCAVHAAGIEAVLGIGGGGGTAMVTAGMRALPIGVPKLMVSTLASGDVASYVDISDIAMMPAVTDLAGLNRISRVVLHNAAQAFRGMAERPAPRETEGRAAVGLTMFGVTTPAVTAVADLIRDRFDPVIFHATGTGGRAMEALGGQGLLAGLLDLTLTEVADHLLGGVLPCQSSRLDVVAARRLPFVGAPGACDMVNFWAPETMPPGLRGRNLYRHNANVTLMRTTPGEAAAIGAWIAAKLNACEGEVRMLLPLGGLSALDVPDGAFWDPEADAALFDALEAEVEPTPRRRVERLPHHINDPAFAARAAEAFLAIA